MNAARVHGGGDVLANISLRFGLRGQYGPDACGIATLRGRFVFAEEVELILDKGVA